MLMALAALGVARREVRDILAEPDAQMQYFSGTNDFGERLWVAHASDACVSMSAGPNGSTPELVEAGTAYDGSRIFNLHGQFAPRVSAPAETSRHDVLFTTLQRFGATYYHYHAETLPKLLLARVVRETRPSVRVLIHRPQGAFARRFLELLALDDSALELTPPDAMNSCAPDAPRCAHFCASTLLLPSPARQGFPGHDALATVRAFALGALGVSPPPRAERRTVVILGRRRARLRRWANEAACVDAVTRAFPDEEVVLYPDEGLPTDEMVRIFARAKLIVGPHGGAFTGIIFAPPGTTVLEVDTNGTTWCYRHIAGALSLDYRPLVGNFTWHTTSIRVDEDALLGGVRRALGEWRDAGETGRGRKRSWRGDGRGGPLPGPLQPQQAADEFPWLPRGR